MRKRLDIAAFTRNDSYSPGISSQFIIFCPLSSGFWWGQGLQKRMKIKSGILQNIIIKEPFPLLFSNKKIGTVWLDFGDPKIRSQHQLLDACRCRSLKTKQTHFIIACFCRIQVVPSQTVQQSLPSIIFSPSKISSLGQWPVLVSLIIDPDTNPWTLIVILDVQFLILEGRRPVLNTQA